MDIMFVLDGSSSVNLTNFESVKLWVRKLSGLFLDQSPKTQIGVIQYSYYMEDTPRYDKNTLKKLFPCLFLVL